jgi:YD repeat-containing protein
MQKSKTFIGFCIVVFILMSSIMSLGATISYQYDDLHRLTRIENHSNGTVTLPNGNKSAFSGNHKRQVQDSGKVT